METSRLIQLTDVSAPEDAGCCGGGCCGGGAHGASDAAEADGGRSGVVEVLGVTGMTCGHCVGAVTKELGAIDGVESVEVALVPGGVSRVTVTAASPLPADAVRQAIDEAGYELAD